MSPPTPAPARWYKNPFLIAFILGAIALTILPTLQRRFLAAPPPIESLPAWELTPLHGGAPITSASLRGKVVMLSLATLPCEKICQERQQFFGRILGHTDDLAQNISIVTAVMRGEGAQIPESQSSRWLQGYFPMPSPLLTALRTGWAKFAGTDAGSTDEEFATLPAIVLIDAHGALRGYWREDVPGRGNAINAARLLARHPEM